MFFRGQPAILADFGALVLPRSSLWFSRSFSKSAGQTLHLFNQDLWEDFYLYINIWPSLSIFIFKKPHWMGVQTFTHSCRCSHFCTFYKAQTLIDEYTLFMDEYRLFLSQWFFFLFSLHLQEKAETPAQVIRALVQLPPTAITKALSTSQAVITRRKHSCEHNVA